MRDLGRKWGFFSIWVGGKAVGLGGSTQGDYESHTGREGQTLKMPQMGTWQARDKRGAYGALSYRIPISLCMVSESRASTQEFRLGELQNRQQSPGEDGLLSLWSGRRKHLTLTYPCGQGPVFREEGSKLSLHAAESRDQGFLAFCLGFTLVSS